MTETENLNAVFEALQGLHEGGQLEAPDYHKAIVALAYDWVQLGDIRSSLMVLAHVPHDYFLNTVEQQLLGDPEYADTVVRLVTTYLRYGVGEQVDNSTAPTAQA